MDFCTFLFVIIVVFVIWLLVTGDEASQKKARTRAIQRKKVRRSNLRKCGYCGKSGHDKRTCPVRRRRSEAAKKAAVTRKQKQKQKQKRQVDVKDVLKGVGIKAELDEKSNLVVSDIVQEILDLLNSDDHAVYRRGITLAKSANIPDINPILEALYNPDYDWQRYHDFFDILTGQVIRRKEVRVGRLSGGLVVAEALQDEVGYGRGRLDTVTRNELGLSIGDIVEIHGRRIDPPTVAIVWKARTEDEGRGVIRLDGLIRNNAKVNLGDIVEVKKAEVKPAQKVVFAPIIDSSDFSEEELENYRLRLFGPGIEEVIRRGLNRRPLTKGDVVIVPGLTLAGGRQAFTVSAMQPRGIVQIQADTAIQLNKGRYDYDIFWVLNFLRFLERDDDKRLIGPLTSNPEVSWEVLLPALLVIVQKHVKGKERINILKFLKSDDSAINMMGVSMLKGILAEE